MTALHPLFQSICEAHGAPATRPTEPARTFPTTFVWYRGWECNYDGDADFWGAEPWRAAKGGWDLDCRQTSGRTWSDLLDEIDAEEAESRA
jgi:hypothetical protein